MWLLLLMRPPTWFLKHIVSSLPGGYYPINFKRALIPHVVYDQWGRVATAGNLPLLNCKQLERIKERTLTLRSRRTSSEVPLKEHQTALRFSKASTVPLEPGLYLVRVPLSTSGQVYLGNPERTCRPSTFWLMRYLRYPALCSPRRAMCVRLGRASSKVMSKRGDSPFSSNVHTPLGPLNDRQQRNWLYICVGQTVWEGEIN